MIKKFTIKNFKNFKNETVFSFEAGKKRELNFHVMKNKENRILPLKVIYGSNSAGKSNIVMAFKVLKNIIITRELKNEQDEYINLCSNFSSLKDYESPMELAIEFILNDNIYDYKIIVQNIHKTKSSKVLEEKLLENNDLLFKRINNKITLSNNYQIIKKHYQDFYDENNMLKKELLEFVEKGLNDNIVFSDWYHWIDKELCEDIYEFFYRKLIIIDNFEELKISVPKHLFNTNKNVKNKYIDKLIKELNAGNQKIYFAMNENNEIEEQVSYTFDNCVISTNAKLTESKGTLKLIDFLSILMYSLDEGSTLIVDELDASIHNEIIVNLIQTYGDLDINKKMAQLVFTTHNPVYMNKSLLRRDEIVFVEKEKNTSTICTLDDYNLRNDEVYLKNYLAGMYTVLPDFDISNIIDK